MTCCRKSSISVMLYYSQLKLVMRNYSIARKRDQWPAPKDTSLSYLSLCCIALHGHRTRAVLSQGGPRDASVVNCYRSCKLSRTLPLVSLQELEDASLWFLSSVSFIGYQFDGGSHSRQQFRHTSVNMMRLHDTCSHTVSRRQRALTALAVVTCVLHRWDSWSFLERGRNTATIALLSKDLVSGTVYPLSCALQTLHLEINWKLICSTSRNCFSAFAAPFLSCAATCELALGLFGPLGHFNNNNNNNN